MRPIDVTRDSASIDLSMAGEEGPTSERSVDSRTLGQLGEMLSPHSEEIVYGVGRGQVP